MSGAASEPGLSIVLRFVFFFFFFLACFHCSDPGHKSNSFL